MGKEHDDRDEIDLLEILFAFRKRILWIILAAVLGGGISFAGTRLLMTPMYESTTTMLVLTSETTLSSLSELQLGTQLTNDYEILTKSRAVLGQVIENLDLDLEYGQLNSLLSISNPEDSRIMEITLTYPDPAEAKAIVDEIAGVTSELSGIRWKACRRRLSIRAWCRQVRPARMSAEIRCWEFCWESS